MTGKLTFEQLLADDSLLETDPQKLALVQARLDLDDKMHAALLERKQGKMDEATFSSTLERASREYSSTVQGIGSPGPHVSGRGDVPRQGRHGPDANT